jgi:DNA polymerase III epsilon subunit-like protein
MDRRHICVFDFETGGLNLEKCEILQIGALILHRTSLKVMDAYKSLMKPLDFDGLDEKALKVNGLTKEQLQEAPEAKVVFPEFCEWIKKFNTSRDNSFFGAPTPCGYNISGFDLPIFDRYCKEYGYWDDRQQRQTVFWPMNRLDVFDHVWMYCRRNADLKKMKLTSILEYCGVSKEEIENGAHDAMWDVEWTAKLAVKFLKLAERLTAVNDVTGKRILEIKDAFAETVTSG